MIRVEEDGTIVLQLEGSSGEKHPYFKVHQPKPGNYGMISINDSDVLIDTIERAKSMAEEIKAAILLAAYNAGLK